MPGIANVKSFYEDGNMIFQLEAGQYIEFRDSTGAKIIRFGETEINSDVTFKAPTVSTEGA